MMLCAAVIGTCGCGRQDVICVSTVRTEDDAFCTEPGEDQESETAEPVSEVTDSMADPSETQLAVYVCGAVFSPGVYYLPPGSRVCDAIDAAGGFSGDADTQWLNLARPVIDSEMLSVCTTEEAASLKELGIGPDQVPDRQGLSGAGETGDLSGKIDLNSASVEQLMTLPGIGESKAEAIIRYREESGPFSCTEDVMNISGIKDRVYSQIEDCITVQ